jgi:anion-transporting  ArsA/GET3 family ATPase
MSCASQIDPRPNRFTVVVGSGGVGKTTLAAALGLKLAEAGHHTLVMTFDPSLRLKDSLGVGDEARERAVEVASGTPGRLEASLLDARRTFDRLVERYAPDAEARERILHNRFYDNLAGNLSGILEYMAVERLFEVAEEARYDCVVLDTPPTRQALDFLEAPERIVSFLDSGAIRIALKPWFDPGGRLRVASRLPGIGKRIEDYLDRIVGLELLRGMAEFFQAFGPLFEGFRNRALKVRELLRSPETEFMLVSRPGESSTPETMFFARHLEQAGYRLGKVVLNRIHPELPDRDEPGGEGGGQGPGREPEPDGIRLLRWLGRRDREGVEEIRALLPRHELVAVPLMPAAPAELAALSRLGALLGELPPAGEAKR